ncbi:MAG: hypothetical protein QM765_30270 [Myxococcales bacterium]
MSAKHLSGILILSLAGCVAQRFPEECHLPRAEDLAPSVTKAPGTYSGYTVSSVSSDRTVTVTGTGSKHFGERTECSVMERWMTDAGVPTFADQDDRCNFEGRLFATLMAAGFQYFAPVVYEADAGGAVVHSGFEQNAVRVEWADMDKAIEIVGGELRNADLGESLTLGPFYQCR